MGTKNNPGKYDCHEKADDDEPLFTLRAKDPLAPILVRLWADLQKVMPDYDARTERVHEALIVAQEMRYWLACNEG